MAIRHKPIRLGMLRCDTHAYWYAPFMVKTDPLKFREHNPVCHHFFTNMYQPTQWEFKPVSGFKLACVWDADRDVAERFASTYDDRPTVCDSPQAMVGHIDAAFIANCDLDGDDHLELARPFLKAGLPTFIDKPFARSWADAKQIVRLATKHGAPLFSSSLLSYTDQVEQLKKRKGEIGPWRQAIVKGANGWTSDSGLEGIAHGIAMALATFGFGVDWVEAMGELPQEYLLLHWPDGRQILVINMDGRNYGGRFSVEVFGRRGTSNTPVRTNIESHGVGDPEFMTAGPKVVKAFRRMVRTGEAPVAYDRILQWKKIAEAGRIAHASGKRVYLKSVR
jgi:predicted dehydrogenase